MPDDLRSFQNLIESTQDTSAWLITWSIVIIVGVTVSIVLALSSIESIIVGIIVRHINVSWKLFVMFISLLQEIVFSTVAILGYIATCIVCAVNAAAAWGEPPALCATTSDYTTDDDGSCGTIYIGLTVITALKPHLIHIMGLSVTVMGNVRLVGDNSNQLLE